MTHFHPEMRVGEYIGDPTVPNANQIIPEHMPEYEFLTNLSAVTTETNVIRLGLIPASDQEPTQIKDVHRAYAEKVDASLSTLIFANFQRDLLKQPAGIIDIEEGFVRRTPMGDVAAACGGLLLRLSYDDNISLHKWLGLRQVRGEIDPQKPMTTPQANRLRVYAQLLAKPDEPIPVDEIITSDPNLARSTTHHLLESLTKDDILTKATLRTFPRLVGWNFAEGNDEVAMSIFRIASRVIRREPDAISEGLDNIDEFLNDPWLQSTLPHLHRRSIRSTGHGRRSEITAFNEELAGAIEHHDSEEEFTAKALTELLGRTVTTQKLHRLIARLGIDAAIQPAHTSQGAKIVFVKNNGRRINPGTIMPK